MRLPSIQGHPAPRNPNSYLIGDFKLTQAAARHDIIDEDRQWVAMSNNARRFQLLPFVSYISLLEAFPGAPGEALHIYGMIPLDRGPVLQLGRGTV